MFTCVFFFFFKQKTAYEMRISDWSSDVCSSDLFCGSSEISSIGGDHAAIETRAAFRCARLCFIIDMDDTEALRKAQGPFQIVEQRPGHIAAHIDPDRKSTRLNSSH